MHIRIKQLADRYLGYLLIAAFLPITRLLGIVLKRNHSLEHRPENILFIKILGLGSLILTLESVSAIKRKYTDARLILLTDNNIANGIAPFKAFDEIWKIESDNPFSVLSKSFRFLFKSWRLKKLWVVDLEVYSKLTTVYSLLTFSINRFGFHLAPVFFRKYLNTHNVIFNQSVFLEDNYLRMAETVAGEIKKNKSPAQQQRKDEHLKPYIVLNNTCSDLAPTRKLPDPTFAEICQWVLEDTSYRLALLGTPKDKESLEKFIRETPALFSQTERIICFSGNNDFDAYYSFLSEQCACLVTIDSGPLHIARALGLPTVSVWGPTNPENYLKVLPEEKERHLYHYKQVSCSPCVHRFEKLPCGGDNFCMKTTEAGTVTAKIRSLLNHIKSQGSA